MEDLKGTGKIMILTRYLVPPTRPDYFRFRTQNFESWLTPQIVHTCIIRPRLGAGLSPQLRYQPPGDSEIVVRK